MSEILSFAAVYSRTPSVASFVSTLQTSGWCADCGTGSVVYSDSCNDLTEEKSAPVESLPRVLSSFQKRLERAQQSGIDLNHASVGVVFFAFLPGHDAYTIEAIFPPDFGQSDTGFDMSMPPRLLLGAVRAASPSLLSYACTVTR